MAIKLGTYDFFAHLISGSFFLAYILYMSQNFLPITIDIANLSIPMLLILGIIAYVLGHVAHQLSSQLWYRFFAPKDLYKKTIGQLSKEVPYVKFDIDNTDWYTLVSYVKKQSIDMAQDIEHYHVISVMHRSISFVLLLFSLTFGVEFFQNNYSYSQLVLTIFSLTFSILLARISVTYHRYFFRSIHQSIIALIMKPEQLPIKLREKAVTKK